MISFSSRQKLFYSDGPCVMGIINATPDSFFAGSRITADNIAETAGNMLENGAAILDIGAQSTRPGATLIDASEELDRLIPAIETVRKTYPDAWISADTFYASVAKAAIDAGADIINDISAGDDDADMIHVISESSVAYVAMHKQGTPQNMQQNPNYGDVVMDVMNYFVQKKSQLEASGIYNWILDPGFGFGKTINHNYSLLKHLGDFRVIGKPILVGVSRKGMIQKVIGKNAENALNGTTALNMYALSRGADILRVHDVSEAIEAVKLWTAIHNS